MPDRMIRHRLGSSNIYLIRGEKGYLMVDAGSTGRFHSFKKLLYRENIAPDEILLILITHVHHDHVGNLRRIKDYTGATVMVHSLESEWLANGKVDVPNGTVPLYKFIAGMGQKRGIKLKFPAAEADIKIDKTTSLEDFGFHASVIPTPGHSIGSVSLFFEDGNAFVGDACFNFPSIKRTILPGFAHDLNTLLQTWQYFIDSDARLFHPGHGKAFTKEKVRRSLMIRGNLEKK